MWYLVQSTTEKIRNSSGSNTLVELFVSKILGGLLFPEICNKFYLIPEQMSWVNKVNDQEDNVK